MNRPLLITVPALLVGTPLATLAAPLVFAVALLVDLVTLRLRQLSTVRLLAFSFTYLWFTSAGVLWMGWLWLRTGGVGVRRPASLERHRVVQEWWVTRLMDAAGPLLNLDVQVDGLELADDGRAVVLSRHASTLDAVVSFQVMGLQAKKKARYVLKRDLLWEPALSIAGRRLPNHFVDRKGRNTEAELAAVGALARGLEPDEVVVIFPEGTFPAPHRRQRALARLADRPQLEALATGYQTLLPPRTGGVRALVENSDGADVIFVGHVGFESCSSIARIWRTIPFPEPVKVKLWRVPASEVPTDPVAQAEWLFEQWRHLDTWVTTELSNR